MDHTSRIENLSSHDTITEEFVRSEAWLDAQRRAFQDAINGEPLEVTLGALARTALQHTRGGARCGFWIADESRSGLHHVVGLQPEYAARIDGFAIGHDSLACGLAVATGKPIITSDVLEDARWADWHWLAEEFGYRGVWSFPVEGDDKNAVGTFAIYFPDPTAPTERDLALAEVMTKAAAVIIALHRAGRARELATEANFAVAPMTSIGTTSKSSSLHPAIRRLNALVPLNAPCFPALRQAMQRPSHFEPSEELFVAGERSDENLLIMNGWAARTQDLKNGRRQVIGFLLPGDLTGEQSQPNPVADATTVALTDLRACVAPEANGLPTLRAAYATNDALHRAYQVAQIVRLGSLDAHDRVVDFLLELHERLSVAGLVIDGSFDLPLKQETIAEALGLSTVHVNRTLQRLRSEGALTWKGKSACLADPASLARQIGRVPTKVSD